MRKQIKTALAALGVVMVLSASSCDPNDVASYLPAERLEVPDKVPPSIPEVPTEFVLGDPGPAMQAFRSVTLARGWLEEDVDLWSPFIQAVMKRESKFCPGLISGDHAALDCTVTKRTKPGNSAAGFGQVLMRVNASWLCPQEGLCSKWDVIASPEASMTALVATIERGGAGPWCYTSALRRGAVCKLAP